MTDNYKAIIARVESLEPIEKADRIELATVSGEQVIVGKGLWNVGDLGVFFPINVLLSHDLIMYNKLYRKNPETGEPMGGYMEEDRRVRYIRMKGVGSRGMFLPTSSLDYLQYKSGIKYSLPVGFEFNELYGQLICEPYRTIQPTIQPKNQKVGKSRSRKFVNFYEIGDTGRLASNFHRYKDSDLLVVTEKLHGTSGRTGYIELEQKKTFIDNVLSKFGYFKDKEFKHVSGTRRTIIGENNKIGDDKNYRDYFHSYFSPKLLPGMIVYYEIVGPGIMPTHNAEESKDIVEQYGKRISYNYGASEGQYEAYVYRIVVHAIDDTPIVYSWDQLVEWCKKYEVKHVPVIDKFIYKSADSAEIMKAIKATADGPSMLDPRHPREGIVVHGTRDAFKFKGDVFCTLEGIMLNSSRYVDPEDQN